MRHTRRSPRASHPCMRKGWTPSFWGAPNCPWPCLMPTAPGGTYPLSIPSMRWRRRPSPGIWARWLPELVGTCLQPLRFLSGPGPIVAQHQESRHWPVVPAGCFLYDQPIHPTSLQGSGTVKGFVDDIEKLTEENDNFRKVLYTGKHMQLVLMTLQPGEDIGLEVHDGHDQFFRIEEGEGEDVINGVTTQVEDDEDRKSVVEGE